MFSLFGIDKDGDALMEEKIDQSQKIFKAFHNLVYEWYGIRLDWLYSFDDFKNDAVQELQENIEQLKKISGKCIGLQS